MSKGELINLWSEVDELGQLKLSAPVVEEETAEEIKLIETMTILVCGRTSDKDYAVWTDSEKKFRKITPYSNGIGRLIIGKFYKIEKFSDGTFKPTLIPDICEVNIITVEKDSVIVAKAPVFIGNQCPATREYIGYNEFFGRVYYDASYTALKVEQFTTYNCTIRAILEKQRDCNWQIHQIIHVERPLRYYLLEVQVDRIEKDGDIFCVRNNLQLLLRREDLRQHCFLDLVSLTTLYVIAFKNQPYLKNCCIYRCCFATLVDDFTETLSNNALVPAEMMVSCCNEKTHKRAAILAELMHNEEFITKVLDKNPPLKERLFKLMLGNIGHSTRFNPI